MCYENNSDIIICHCNESDDVITLMGVITYCNHLYNYNSGIMNVMTIMDVMTVMDDHCM